MSEQTDKKHKSWLWVGLALFIFIVIIVVAVLLIYFLYIKPNEDKGKLNHECNNGQCDQGLVCYQNKCVPGGKVNDSCNTNLDCDSGLICDQTTHKCKKGGQVNDPCTTNTECDLNLICDTKTHKCVVPPKPPTPNLFYLSTMIGNVKYYIDYDSTPSSINLSLFSLSLTTTKPFSFHFRSNSANELLISNSNYGYVYMSARRSSSKGSQSDGRAGELVMSPKPIPNIYELCKLQPYGVGHIIVAPCYGSNFSIGSTNGRDIRLISYMFPACYWSPSYDIERLIFTLEAA